MWGQKTFGIYLVINAACCHGIINEKCDKKNPIQTFK